MMLKLIKDLFLGEPAFATGLIATGLAAWVAALVAMGSAVPVGLAVSSPVATAIGAWYTRQHVEPLVVWSADD